MRKDRRVEGKWRREGEERIEWIMGGVKEGINGARVSYNGETGWRFKRLIIVEMRSVEFNNGGFGVAIFD